MDASPEDWSHADNSYPEDGSWDDQDSFYEYARFEMDKDEAASRTSSQRTRWSESSVEHMLGKHPMSRSPSHERDPVKRFKRTDSVGSNFSKPTLESLGSTNQDLVRQLKMEQEKNKVLAQELQELRRKNAEQEALLSEIRDECRTPFVVPSLLDAFMAVSKMTTAATIDSVH
ncbi:hypothetical protein CPB85DRAFT_398142 [Mucidula mucida]|nr:hypothetical protein CPB85DRAFT_398142 [Mucidula mucida]